MACVVLLAVLLAAQAVAYSSQPSPGISTARSMGKAGFAYLGGLRTFAAAVIWNRIEPQYHQYFQEVTLTEQTFVVPKMRLVTILDPSFTDAYNVLSLIVFEKVGHDEGIAVAREGLAKNPNSGILRANLLQLLLLQDKVANRAEILRYAKATLAPDATWLNGDEEYEGYGITASALDILGEDEVAARIKQQLEVWRGEGVGAVDHDHDGDGKQDH
jgi:hypothetical protein